MLVADNVPNSLILFTLMMEAIRSSDMSVLTTATRRHIPEHDVLQNQYRVFSTGCTRGYQRIVLVA
jgi:hypothetical protein